MASKVFWLTVRYLRGKGSQNVFFIEDSNDVFLKDQGVSCVVNSMLARLSIGFPSDGLGIVSRGELIAATWRAN